MPLYEYQCGTCGRFELIRKFSDPLLTACPTCGNEVQKLPSAPAIQFKGTGWYITDYARKSGGEGASPSSTASPSSSSKDGKESSASKDAKESSTTKDAKESSTPQAGTSKEGPASGRGSSK